MEELGGTKICRNTESVQRAGKNHVAEKHKQYGTLKLVKVDTTELLEHIQRGHFEYNSTDSLKVDIVAFFF